MDSVPVFSQCKSAFQALYGDTEGARKTQEKFLKTCPIISHATSGIQAYMGDMEGAWKTQLGCANFLNDCADAVPVVGHIKGVIHYACGEKERGDKAMKSSSRFSGVLIGGMAGFAVGGPPGAFAGGAAGGLAMDALTTGMDSAIHHEFRPSGTIAAVNMLVEGKSKSVSGDIFDLVVGTLLDGMAGIAGGELVGRMSKVYIKGEANALNVPKNKQFHVKGAIDDVKSLKGDDIRRMKKQAGDLAKAKQEIKNNPTLSACQVKELKNELFKKRVLYTQHNIHALTYGQIAVDLKPKSSSGRRCAERFIFNDPKRNYQLKVAKYTDVHNYKNQIWKSQPGLGVFTRAANFVADRAYTAAAVYLAVAASQNKKDDVLSST